MADNFQRAGSISNAHVGRDFEAAAISVFAQANIQVTKDFAVDVGVGNQKKPHNFELGSASPPILVECKSHRWTSGNNVPSAKVTVWNEAMYYFHCAPPEYWKILFVLKDERGTTGESLSSYYIRIYGHLIPDETEIWELDEQTGRCEIVHGG